jgi:hypothetical protein
MTFRRGRGVLVGVAFFTGLIRGRFPFGLGDPYEYLAIRFPSAVDEGLSTGSCFMMCLLNYNSVAR